MAAQDKGVLARIAPHYYAIAFVAVAVFGAGGAKYALGSVAEAQAATERIVADHDRAIVETRTRLQQVEAEREHLRAVLDDMQTDIKEIKTDTALVRCQVTHGKDCKR